MFFSGRYIANMIQYGVSIGLDVNEVMRLTGMDFNALCAEDSRVDVSTYISVFDFGISKSGDPHFGLHLGEHLNLSAAGLIGQISQVSANVGEALEKSCEFGKLTTDAISMKMASIDQGYKLEFKPQNEFSDSSESAVRHTIDGLMVFSIREYQSLTMFKSYPEQVGLSYPKPENSDEYMRLLGPNVVFGQGSDYLLFSDVQVDEQILSGDMRLLQILVEEGQRRLEEWSENKSFSSVVKSSVMRLIQPGIPTIEQVASHLNLSVRTLQRRLGDEGSSFKQIVQDMRRELAMTYLKDPNLTVEDISFLLGYSDTSAFTRTFKTWKGLSPTSWRNQTLGRRS